MVGVYLVQMKSNDNESTLKNISISFFFFSKNHMTKRLTVESKHRHNVESCLTFWAQSFFTYQILDDAFVTIDITICLCYYRYYYLTNLFAPLYSLLTEILWRSCSTKKLIILCIKGIRSWLHFPL